MPTKIRKEKINEKFFLQKITADWTLTRKKIKHVELLVKKFFYETGV